VDPGSSQNELGRGRHLEQIAHHEGGARSVIFQCLPVVVVNTYIYIFIYIYYIYIHYYYYYFYYDILVLLLLYIVVIIILIVTIITYNSLLLLKKITCPVLLAKLLGFGMLNSDLEAVKILEFS